MVVKSRVLPAAEGVWLTAVLLLSLQVASIPFLPFGVHAAAAMGTVVGLGGVSWWLGRRRGVELRPVRPGTRAMVLSVVAGTGCAIGGTATLTLAQRHSAWAAEVLDAYTERLEVFLAPNDPSMIPLVLLTVALLPGVFEELAFRRLVLERLRPLGTPTAIVISGLLFGAIHVNAVSFVPLALIGMVFGLLTVRTGTWASAAIAHVTLNGINGVVMPRWGDVSEAPTVVLASAVLGGATIALGAALGAGSDAGRRPRQGNVDGGSSLADGAGERGAGVAVDER